MKAAIGGESGADEGRLLADEGRARFTARIQAPARRPREVVELAIDPSQLHCSIATAAPRSRSSARWG